MQKPTKTARQRKIGACKRRERGLCKNNENRKTQKFRHIAAKQKRRLLTLLSDAPGVLSHFYCLPWQKYILTASSCWACGRPVTSRKEKTRLPWGSADWTAQASCTLQLQEGTAALPPLAEHKVCITRAPTHQTCPNPTSKSTRASLPRLRQSSVPLTTTFNTDKGVEAIRKHLYRPLLCRKRWKAIYL